MGYRILYDNGEILLEHKTSKRNHGIWISALFICLLLFGVIKLFGWEEMKNILLPGSTEAAISGLVARIRTGESVKNAITAFCNEIIGYAK